MSTLTAIIDSRMLGDVHRRSLDRLTECVSSDTFTDVVGRAMNAIGSNRIDTPQQLLVLGDTFIARSKDLDSQYAGTIAMMGRLMRTRAILLGAKV